VASRIGGKLPGHPVARWGILFGGALLLAVVLGGLAGAVTADPSMQPYESSAQESLLQGGAGPPDQWILADGPVKPGGEIHRTETWVYQDGERSRFYQWLDGRLIEDGPSPPTAYERDPNLPGPNRFHRGMSIQDVMKILDEEPTWITVDEAPFELSKVYLFEKSQLVISFHEDRLLTVQTW
jgi:hypothetical protein